MLTSYLAANAIILPATGWLTARLGRRRFFLVCTALFTISSFLSGIAPSLEFLIAMRILQGLGGGPLIPIAQAVLWEIFPPRQRGMAMAVWGLGIVLAPTFGPTVGGWIADNWSWRWIFYINLPIGVLGFFMASVLLFDSPHTRRLSTRARLRGSMARAACTRTPRPRLVLSLAAPHVPVTPSRFWSLPGRCRGRAERLPSGSAARAVRGLERAINLGLELPEQIDRRVVVERQDL